LRIAKPQEYRLAASVIDFESYLKAQKKRNVRQIMSYTQGSLAMLEKPVGAPVATQQL
jgi:hypothetical protein